jgi:dihydroorotate dehydrogenase (NAD+) catalytic subunit
VGYGVQLAGLAWRNPVTVGSGFFVPWVKGLGEDDVPLDALGAITVKSVSLVPWSGNPHPHTYRFAHGMLNSIGIINPGVEALVRDHLPSLRRYGVPVITSLAAESQADFVDLARRLDACGLTDAVEINMSCPNTARAQMAFGQSPQAAGELVAAVRAVTRLPVLAKLTPNCTDVAAVARACEAAGADGLVLINTLLAMGLDAATALPRTGTVTAGLSGPAIKPVALRIVWECREAVALPIIGLGGISCAEDALEFILAGATAVGVGTAGIGHPEMIRSLVADLEALVAARGGDTAALSGLAHRNWAARAGAGTAPPAAASDGGRGR